MGLAGDAAGAADFRTVLTERQANGLGAVGSDVFDGTGRERRGAVGECAADGVKSVVTRFSGEEAARRGSVAGQHGESPSTPKGLGVIGGHALAPAAEAEGVPKCGGVDAALQAGTAACSLFHSRAACRIAGSGWRLRLLSCASNATCQTRAMSRISRAPSASAPWVGRCSRILAVFCFRHMQPFT